VFSYLNKFAVTSKHWRFFCWKFYFGNFVHVLLYIFSLSC
jgi:hypothetical protein